MGEDVAQPDQVEVREADQEERRHAPVMDGGRAVPMALRCVGDEQDRGAEQEGEQAAHLALDEDEGDEPGKEIGGRRATPGERGKIRGLRQAEGGQIGDQNAHDRDAADHIQRQ